MIQKDLSHINWHNISQEEAVKRLFSDSKKGLSENEVKERQKKFGLNRLPEEKPLSAVKIFFEQFKSPLIYVLIIAGIITLLLRDYTDSIIIFAAVFLNAIVGFWQENKTAKTLQELKKAITHPAEVLRDGNLKIIDFQEIVPGDIIILNAGSNVPADARIIECHELKVNESALTGEWLLANKKTDILEEKTSLSDRDNMVFMGTAVEGGKGKAIVTAIGLKTEIGKIAEMLREVEEEKTPYQKKLARFAKIVGGIILFLCFIIFVLGIARGQEFVLMFTTVVAVAVAAIPEGLPVAVTLVFTFGMREILKRKGLVRKLIAAETLGSTSIIATDKTGTLTEAKMEVAEIHTLPQIFYQKENRRNEDHSLVFKIVSLCSESFIENLDQPMEKWIVRGRPTDKALLVAAIQAGFNKKELEEKEPKIDEIPFDSAYKYSAALHLSPNKKEKVIYLMGAPEIILDKSKFLELEGKQEKVDFNKIEKIREKYTDLTSQGFRVVAVAYRKTKVKKEISDRDLQNMVFVGLIALHDPVRKRAAEAIENCRLAGMKPIIVTGDHKLTAKTIAERIGFKINKKNILEGKDLKELSDEDFEKIFKDIEIYARVTPEQKLRIVQVWQERGEVVAMTGDGVNDAPALKKANIGVALGSGTEVAKEASDLTLLTDDFEIIIVAVEEGRRIIDNVRKIITYLLTGGFTEVIIIGLSVVFHLPLPVLAGQILWKNLVESTPPSLALAFEPKERGVMKRKPEPLNSPLLTKQMRFLIFFIGFLTNFLLFAIFLWFLKSPDYGMAKIDQIRTIIFVALAIDSFFFIFSFRNLKQNIWQYNPFSNSYLNFAAFGGFLLLLAAIYLPLFQLLLKTTALGFFEWLILVFFGLINIILIEAAKWYYIKTKRLS